MVNRIHGTRTRPEHRLPGSAKLQQRIETLEGKAQPGGPRGIGLKPKAGRKPAQPRGPLGRFLPPAHDGWSMPWTPARSAAPDWRAAQTREVIDIPAVPAQATEMSLSPAFCEQRRTPRADWGKQRLGINLVSLIAALREEARLPYRTIQWYANRASTVPEWPGSSVGWPGRPRVNWGA